MKTYEIILLTGSGRKTEYYHDTQPLADFEKQMTNKYKTFVMLSSAEVNISPKNQIMKTEHTAGKWMARKPNVDLWQILTDGESVCMLPTKDERSEANAKLIAAAPELYKMAEHFLAHLKGENPMPHNMLKAELKRILNTIEQ